MTLSEFAWVLGVKPKVVLNTLATLGRTRRYSLTLARQFAVMYAIHQATGIPVVRSFAMAGVALRQHDGTDAAATIPTSDASVTLAVDMQRILSAFHARRSALRTTYAPRQRGRRASLHRDPLERAADWGIDVGLLRDNAGKTVEMRIRQLDAMVSFAQRVQRLAPSPN